LKKIALGGLTALLALAGLLSATTVFAHAVITEVVWDDPHMPTTLTATSGSDDISDEAGTFYLQVFDADGNQVDNGDTQVIGPKQMSVTVQAGLAPGSYRVDWLAASADDGDSADGTLMIDVLAADEEPAMDHEEPAADHGDEAEADHDHGDEAVTGHDEAEEVDPLAEAISDACHHLSVPETWVVELLGANQVPEPVDSPVSGLARLTFDPATRSLTYAITVSGVSPSLITAAHLHFGGPDETGPHAFDFINEGFTQVSGTTVLEHDAYHALCEGNLYINLHSVEHPDGAARGQVQVPSIAAAFADGSSITPPSTGDAGLVGGAGNGSGLLAALLLIGLFGAATTLARRQAGD
jgi:methionine-rich copper-binding protein CopC